MQTTPSACWKCTPIPACGGTSSGGGSTVGRRGAFPTGASPVCLFFNARLGGCKGFIIRGALHKLNGTHQLPPTAALGSFPRKELGGALRIGPKDLTPLSSVAYGATRWPGFKVFALCAGYAHS